MNTIIPLMLLVTAGPALAEVTPLDNEALQEQVISQPRAPNQDDDIEKLEALQDQQRMLPREDPRIMPMTTPPQQPPPPDQQLINQIINNINALQPPPGGL